VIAVKIMGPKRFGPETQPRDLAKVFRSSFLEVTVETFSGLVEECVSRHEDFFVDFWSVHRYASESKILTDLLMVWPALGLAKARQIAKSLKGQLGAIQYKKSKSTSGKKTPKALAELFKRLHEHASRSSGSADRL